MEDSPDWWHALTVEQQQFVEKLQPLDNYPTHLAKFANALYLRYQNNNKKQIACDIALYAWNLSPNDSEVHDICQWAINRQIPRWHYAIVADEARNSIYRQALETCITPESIVYEIGTGSGLLALIAARAGAKHVYTCEQHPLVAKAAKENIKKNGYADKITVINKTSYDITIGEDIPSSPDILVSEIIDNSLLGENVLPIMKDCWARILKPESLVLPKRIRAVGALIGGKYWCRSSRMYTAEGFNLSAMNLYGSTTSSLKITDQDINQASSKPEPLLSFDISSANLFNKPPNQIIFTATKDGIIDGVLQWLTLEFDNHLYFDNCPPKQSAWAPVIHYFHQSITVKAGDRLSVRVSHDQKKISIQMDR